jgi:hypothetical protein
MGNKGMIGSQQRHVSKRTSGEYQPHIISGDTFLSTTQGVFEKSQMDAIRKKGASGLGEWLNQTSQMN